VVFFGSAQYVKELSAQQGDKVHKIQPAKHLFYVNLDTLGTVLGFNFCYIAGPSEVTAVVEALSRELGVPHQIKEAINGSDNLPFTWGGIPNVALVRKGPVLESIHTEEDTVDLMDINQLKQIGKFIDTFLTRTAARAEVWPFERQIPEKLAKEAGDIRQRLDSKRRA